MATMTKNVDISSHYDSVQYFSCLNSENKDEKNQVVRLTNRKGTFKDKNLIYNDKPNHMKNLDYGIFQGDCKTLLESMKSSAKFTLINTSPPYNIQKCYESKKNLEKYTEAMSEIVDLCVKNLSEDGTICWQVGVTKDESRSEYLPLEYVFHPLFAKHGLVFRNRIVWTFGHGLNSNNRFSGRHETIMVYQKDPKKAKFNLDDVRIAQKYKNKKKNGILTCNPLGKNPGDVWDTMPNVKSHHVEKMNVWDKHNKKWICHPCQFPVGLAERCILAYTDKNDLVFDPFMGVGSTGVAAAIHSRKFWGCELFANFAAAAQERIQSALDGTIRYRPHDKPIQEVPKGA